MNLKRWWSSPCRNLWPSQLNLLGRISMPGRTIIYMRKQPNIVIAGLTINKQSRTFTNKLSNPSSCWGKEEFAVYYFLENSQQEYYSEVIKIVKLMPATNAMSERNFSALHKLKRLITTKSIQAELHLIQLLIRGWGGGGGGGGQSSPPSLTPTPPVSPPLPIVCTLA